MRLRAVFVALAALALGLFGLAGAAAAQEAGARLTAVHNAGVIPAVAIALDGEVVVESLANGATAGPLDIAAGDHTVLVGLAENAEDGELSEDEVVFTDEFTAVAGFSYTYTAELDDEGEPVLNIAAEPFGPTGVLVFVHDITGGPSVTLAIRPGGVADQEVTDFQEGDDETIAAGETIEISNIPPGTHTLIIRDAAGTTDLGSTQFTITADQETTLRASAVLGGAAPAPSPSPTETATVRPPRVVQTGAGGTQGGTATGLVLLAGGLVAAGAGAAVVARRKAA
jgi:hypothetical protein